jgi:hypothetical protein
MIACVYCRPLKKTYTKDVEDPRNWLRQQRYRLKQGKHGEKELQQDFDRYGHSKFDFLDYVPGDALNTYGQVEMQVGTLRFDYQGTKVWLSITSADKKVTGTLIETLNAWIKSFSS